MQRLRTTYAITAPLLEDSLENAHEYGVHISEFAIMGIRLLGKASMLEFSPLRTSLQVGNNPDKLIPIPRLAIQPEGYTVPLTLSLK